MRTLFVAFASTRVLLVLVAIATSGRGLLAIAHDWDAGWYLEIARNGYSFTPGEQSSIAFAPALPLLMRIVRRDDETALLIGGLLITNAALVIAVIFLYKLVRLDHDDPTARRAALYLLAFPSTLFLSLVYPHSLFLAAAIASVYSARRERWALSGALGGLASLTRIEGILLVLPLAYEYLVEQRLGLRKSLLWLTLPPLALLGFLGYSAWRFQTPFAMFAAQSAWHRSTAVSWHAFEPYLAEPWGAHGGLNSPLDLAFTLVLGALVALCWPRLRPPLALFATAIYVLFISSGSLVSSMRLGLELFPIFIVLAISGRSKRFHYAFVLLSGALALRFAAIYASGTWLA